MNLIKCFFYTLLFLFVGLECNSICYWRVSNPRFFTKTLGENKGALEARLTRAQRVTIVNNQTDGIARYGRTNPAVYTKTNFHTSLVPTINAKSVDFLQIKKDLKDKKYSVVLDGVGRRRRYITFTCNIAFPRGMERRKEDAYYVRDKRALFHRVFGPVPHISVLQISYAHYPQINPPHDADAIWGGGFRSVRADEAVRGFCNDYQDQAGKLRFFEVIERTIRGSLRDIQINRDILDAFILDTQNRILAAPGGVAGIVGHLSVSVRAFYNANFNNRQRLYISDNLNNTPILSFLGRDEVRDFIVNSGRRIHHHPVKVSFSDPICTP